MIFSSPATAIRPRQSSQSDLVLQTSHLRKTYGALRVLDDVSFEIRQGEVVLLRGPNGSGKTTLLNILTGYLQPDLGTIQVSTGRGISRMQFPRPWWKNVDLFDHFTPERMARAGLGRTWQEGRLFPSQSVFDNVAVAAPHQHGENPLWATFRPRMVTSQDRRNLDGAHSVLADVGLGGREDATAEAVSLGQSKRVAVARAIRAGARVLFLDEPLAGLDRAGVEEIVHLLRQLVECGDLTLVIVEHVLNIPIILTMATTVWTLRAGRLDVESAAQVITTLPAEVTGAQFEDVIKQSRPDLNSVDSQRLPGGAILSILSLSRPQPTDEFDLEVVDIIVRRGRRLVIGTEGPDGTLQGLTFRVRRGELAVIHASNGWGKTTLLGAIAGLVPIEKGEIRLRGRRIDGLQPWERARLGLSLLQSHGTLFESLTVRETLVLAHVDDVPESIAPFLDRRVSTLSGGEARKVGLACVCRTALFKVGLLDEPMIGLDQDAVRTLGTLLADLLGAGAVLVAVPSTVISEAGPGDCRYPLKGHP